MVQPGGSAVETRPCADFNLTESVFNVVLQKSIPTQIRKLILYISMSEERVDEFMRELTSAKRLCKHLV